MRRSSLRRSSVVALASASVGLAAPIPEPGFSLFGGQSSGQSGSSSNLISGNSLNGLISSLTNLVGQSGSVKTGVNVQAQIEDILKSFGVQVPSGTTGGTGSSSSSPVPSPSSSPKGSISGISIGGTGNLNVGNIASAANNVVKQIESTVNGVVSTGGNAAVGFSNPFGSAGIQVGTQASVSPPASPRVASPTVSPVIPTISPSVASPSPVAAPVTGSVSVGVSPQVGVQGAVNAGQNIANGIANQVKGVTDTATSIGKDVISGAAKTVQSAVTNPLSASASVGVTGSSTTTSNNPFSGLSNILGSGTGSNFLGTSFGNLLNPTATKNSGSGLSSIFQFGHA